MQEPPRTVPALHIFWGRFRQFRQFILEGWNILRSEEGWLPAANWQRKELTAGQSGRWLPDQIMGQSLCDRQMPAWKGVSLSFPWKLNTTEYKEVVFKCMSLEG